MGEGLGEVAQVLARGGVDLFGVELQRPGEGEQLLAECPGALYLADFENPGQRRDVADRGDGSG